MGLSYNCDLAGNVTVAGGLNLPVTNGGTSAVSTQLTNFEVFSFNTSLSGVGAVATYSCVVRRINNFVQLTLPSWSIGSASTSTTMVSPATLPARFRPLVDQYVVLAGTTGLMRNILVRIATTGILTFYGDDSQGSFQKNLAAGFSGGVISYGV